jgi:hypothetical protein
VVLTAWELERRRDAQSGRLRESAWRGAGAFRRFRPSCRVQRPDWTDPSVHRAEEVGLEKSANGSVAYRALSEPRDKRSRPDQADGTMTEATRRGPPRRPT